MAVVLPAPAPELTPESAAAVQALGTVELVVSVHALDRARHVGPLLDAASRGLAEHFADRKTALLVADTGVHEETREAIRSWVGAAGSPARALAFRRPVDRGRAVQGLLAAARAVGAGACALIDGDLPGVPPAWMDRLLRPVVMGEADYVGPAYTRTVVEGTLTTNLLAPLTGALYGKRIQQLAGGCAGLSGVFLGQCLDDETAPAQRSGVAVEIWLATQAVATGARVVETHLGRKPVDPEAAQPDLATTLVRTVGPVFDQMEHHRPAWLDVEGGATVPVAGEPPATLPDPGGAPRVERMVRAFRLGLKDLLPVWEQIMPEATLAQLYPLTLLAEEEFRLSPALWARVVVDFALAHHERRVPHDHLLRALTPLYLGRVAAFLLECRARGGRSLGDVLETIDRAFEAAKEGLVARWR